MKIGILKETKTPVDRRVPFTPEQVKQLMNRYPMHEFLVEASPVRAFSDEEYRDGGIQVVEDIRDCDILMGVKEVGFGHILPHKTYIFFSHTAKEQPHNREMFRTLSERQCTLIDYEYLVENNVRVVAFGHWAGIAGAYNALLGYGLLSRNYELRPAPACRGLEDLRNELPKIKTNRPLKIVITGEGRVAGGAAEILLSAGIRRIRPEDFLLHSSQDNIFCHAGPQHYTRHFTGRDFDFNDFVKHPGDYESNFISYLHKANLLIACHFWDVRSPHFFTPLDMQHPDFRIRLISDISCDIPGPIPSTLRVSDMNDPFYGVRRKDASEIPPFDPDQLTVSAVDNLPSALPRDASGDFGKALLEKVMPALLSGRNGEMIRKATLLKEGKLTPFFRYLEQYLSGATP